MHTSKHACSTHLPPDSMVGDEVTKDRNIISENNKPIDKVTTKQDSDNKSTASEDSSSYETDSGEEDEDESGEEEGSISKNNNKNKREERITDLQFEENDSIKRQKK